MTIAIRRRSFFDVMIGEPLELVKSQPHESHPPFFHR